MAQIIINNSKVVSGRNISITNGKITVDGKRIDIEENDKVINILVQGDVESIDVDACERIDIKGNSKTVRTTSGNVYCYDVQGDVTTTSGDIDCDNVAGSAKTVSGDVVANRINGSVNTVSGDIHNK